MHVPCILFQWFFWVHKMWNIKVNIYLGKHPWNVATDKVGNNFIKTNNHALEYIPGYPLNYHPWYACNDL